MNSSFEIIWLPAGSECLLRSAAAGAPCRTNGGGHVCQRPSWQVSSAAAAGTGTGTAATLGGWSHCCVRFAALLGWPLLLGSNIHTCTGTHLPSSPTNTMTCWRPCSPPPPSHGFCLFNNVAIGAAYAMNVYRHAGVC